MFKIELMFWRVVGWRDMLGLTLMFTALVMVTAYILFGSIRLAIDDGVFFFAGCCLAERLFGRRKR